MMTTKGEAVALGIAMMSTVEMSTATHGAVAKIKRCIMERNLYPTRWGLGPTASKKKALKAAGKLDKYGRPNESTPAEWKDSYKDYSGPRVQDDAAEVAEVPAPAVEVAPAKEPAVAVPAEAESKKRKKHGNEADGETEEQRLERKRQKAEKKAAKAEKKAAKAAKKSAKADSDESD